MLQIANDARQTVDKVLNPMILTRNSLCDHLHLLIVRQRDWQWRRYLLLINHHEVALPTETRLSDVISSVLRIVYSGVLSPGDESHSLM
jgi:hypothetical protein